MEETDLLARPGARRGVNRSALWVLLAVCFALVGTACGLLSNTDEPAADSSSEEQGAGSSATLPSPPGSAAPSVAVTTPTATAPTQSETAGTSAAEATVATSASSNASTSAVASSTAVETSDATQATATPTSTTAAAEPDLNRARVALVPWATFARPIDLIAPPRDPALWVAERAGRVLRVDAATGAHLGVLLDVSSETTVDGERGLLGIEATDGWLFVSRTNLAGHSEVWAHERSEDGTSLTGFRRLLLTVDQPFSNHNGGDLALDGAGNLLVALGDGGSGGDPLGSGQDASTLLGSILRITPTPRGEQPYATPSNNPFVDDANVRPETWLYGARNPWRISVDAPTGDLWVADVGQSAQEEVNLLPAATGAGRGANLGWNVREGLVAYREAGGDVGPFVDPIWVYGRDGGCSVTGGHVYRGQAISDLAGAYVFGDYCTSQLWALLTHNGAVVAAVDLGVTVPRGQLVAFGIDHTGEMLMLSLDGAVYRLVAAS